MRIFEVAPQEAAENNCVYRNEIAYAAGERTQVLQDVAADPTLPRTKAVRCAQSGHGEAVFFQATARGEEGMTLFAATRTVVIDGGTGSSLNWVPMSRTGTFTGSFEPNFVTLN
ncbi:DNA-directed RNA polymerases II, IV and V subunit 9A [Tanacetum coccineum]